MTSTPVLLRTMFRCATILALLVATAASRADMLTINAAADATITDPGTGTFTTVDSSSLVNSVRAFPSFSGLPVDRSVITFNLAAIPAGATINSVSFGFFTSSFTSPSAGVDLLGFARNGSAFTTADATAAATLLGSYSPASLGLFAHTVGLNAAASALLQSLLGGGNLVALRMQATANGQSENTQILSRDAGPFGPGPSLTVDYTLAAVPDSSATLSLFGIGLVAVFGCRRLQRKVA